MKDFAPHIYRQRLIVEGIYTIFVTPENLKWFLEWLSLAVGMKILWGPFIMNEAGKINPLHAGYEGVLIWAESGCMLYTWDEGKFFSLDIYSCKKFDIDLISKMTAMFFKTTRIDHRVP